MHDLLQNSGPPRDRDAVQERRERQRYWLLTGVQQRSGDRRDVPVPGLEVGEALSLSREDTFRLIQFLAHHGFLSYQGAGPRVCITDKGMTYLTRDAGRRRSIRDP